MLAVPARAASLRSATLTAAVWAFPTYAASAASTLEPRSLARAQTIRAQLDDRYRVLPRRGLAVNEATSTGVVESFALLAPDLLEARFLPAENGIWYAIWPVRATCPYPPLRFAAPLRARSAPAGARARAPHVPRDVSRRRCGFASNRALHRLRRRREGSRARSTYVPWRARSAAIRARALCVAADGRQPSHATAGVRRYGARALPERTGLLGRHSTLADRERVPGSG
jgi:hypothetical protein